jgi:hypothetical protein
MQRLCRPHLPQAPLGAGLRPVPSAHWMPGIGVWRRTRAVGLRMRRLGCSLEFHPADSLYTPGVSIAPSHDAAHQATPYPCTDAVAPCVSLHRTVSEHHAFLTWSTPAEAVDISPAPASLMGATSMHSRSTQQTHCIAPTSIEG